MADRLAKDQLFAAFASVAKALGNGRRAEIVDVLAQGERSVDELAAEIGQSVANTSQHLQRARRRPGLVQSRRAGTRVFYRPASDRRRAICGRRCATWPPSTWPSVEVLADAYLGDRAEVEQRER